MMPKTTSNWKLKTFSFLMLAFLLVQICACRSAAPQEYPNYYKGWKHLSPKLRNDLDHARQDLKQPNNGEARLLRFARLAARLANSQASLWLKTPQPTQSSWNSPASRRRSRVVESCRHALSLYSEAQLLEASIRWQDQVNQVWMLFLCDRDLEANAALALILANPEIDPSIKHELGLLQPLIESMADQPNE